MDYSEYPIILKGNSNEIKGHYRINFTLLATKRNENDFEFYAVKFYEEVKNGAVFTRDISFSNTDKFSGLVHVLDKNNELFFARKLKDGTILDQRLFQEKNQSTDNSRMAEDCYTVTTYHYTDWYVNGVYADSWLNYTSYETFCYSYYLPDLYTGGGGGGGSYASSTGGDAYNNCGDPVHGCMYKLFDSDLISYLEETGGLNIDDQDYDHLNECEKALVKIYPTQALKIKTNRDKAHQKTIALFGSYANGNGHNDCADAFRHAYFNALNTRSVGATITQKFGDAHECDTPESEQKEKEMDLFNNTVGRQVALDSPYASENTLADLILVDIDAGNLKYLSPLGVNNTLLPETQLIQTNSSCR